MELRPVVVCEPVRTPIGRYGGVFRGLSAADLASSVLRALLDRTHLPPERIDDVIFGQCYPNGEAPAVGRVAALDAGLPVTVPGMQVDRRCGSGLQAVLDAAMRVQTGVADLVLAGGVESMSQAEHYAVARWGSQGDIRLKDRLERGRITVGGLNHVVQGGMLETAENLRGEYGISRLEQDELALESHRRAAEAQRAGRFAREIATVTCTDRQGAVVEVAVDEHPRPDTTLERLSTLKPVRLAVDAEATVTAGNASGQNDAAAVCVVTHPEAAESLGLRPLVRLVAWAAAGVEPHRMGIGPVPATEGALNRAGLTLADMELIELNEAFAAQVLAVTRAWGFGSLDFNRLNVNGSGISLGHPVGATGVRILTTLAHELVRREARYGLATMCIGGGQGLAAVFERWA